MVRRENREWRIEPAESETQRMYASSLYGNREIPRVANSFIVGPVGEGMSRTSDMNALGKSDWGIVSVKRANKGVQPDTTWANHRRSSWRKGPGPRGTLTRRP